MDSLPTELLELQTRFETWRSSRKYIREPMPDELRSAALEMLRRYSPSLISLLSNAQRLIASQEELPSVFVVWRLRSIALNAWRHHKKRSVDV